MTRRHRQQTHAVTLTIRAAVTAGGLAFAWLAVTVSTATASTPLASITQSSAADTYGGQGRHIEPVSTSQLPFTGLNLALLIAGAVALIALGTLLRWRIMRQRPSTVEEE